MNVPRPWTLIAELTYACPLRCVYCSNPVAISAGGDAMSLQDWRTTLRQAEELGVVQVHFSGGEPLLFRGLAELVAEARELGLYSTLVTSGVPLERARLVRLADAGLEHVQLSLQSTSASVARALAGHDCLESKLDVARWVKQLGMALTLNVVVTRQNVEQVPELIELAERMRCQRLELANAQYLGWALVNRDGLLPSRAQLAGARQAARAARERLQGTLDVVFVLPDYYSGRPRACMEGWANRYVVVTPDGRLLPCHAAHVIADLQFDDVRQAPLSELWARSPALQRFRGDAWMSAPCRRCPSRRHDFGGCRCQAHQLLGDAGAPDPACELTPAHALVRRARQSANGAGSAPVPLEPRRPPRQL